MKYILAIFLLISTISFAEKRDTIVECSDHEKTTTIIIENDTIIHTDSTDNFIHEVFIKEIIERTNDIYHFVQKKDYGRLICALLVLGFVGYSCYKKRKSCKQKKN